MNILQMSQADNDKQEIDRIISTVATFSLDIFVGVSKFVAERNSETKQVMRYLQYFPLICSIYGHKSVHSIVAGAETWTPTTSS
jgi:hypothetical protein